jgi:predicted esterase YcpF (UPF0227 family)
MTATHLLYLHGFRSSPRSAKALRMAAWVAKHRPDLVFACPQLPPSPAEAIALLTALTRDWPTATTALMGSSLGGFYATVMAQRLPESRVVLLNPAVDPARDLAAYIGEQTCWQDDSERFFFRPAFVDELKALTPGPLTDPARFCAVIAKGDELLDWREMLAQYAAGRVMLLEGSDHGLTDFDDHLAKLTDFLRL